MCCILQDHQCRAVSNICTGKMLLKAGSVVMLVMLEKNPGKNNDTRDRLKGRFRSHGAKGYGGGGAKRLMDVLGVCVGGQVDLNTPSNNAPDGFL